MRRFFTSFAALFLCAPALLPAAVDPAAAVESLRLAIVRRGTSGGFGVATTKAVKIRNGGFKVATRIKVSGDYRLRIVYRGGRLAPVSSAWLGVRVT